MNAWLKALIDPRCGGYYSDVPCLAQSCREDDVYCEAHSLLIIAQVLEGYPIQQGIAQAYEDWLMLGSAAYEASEELNKLTPEEYAAKVVHNVIGSDPT